MGHIVFIEVSGNDMFEKTNFFGFTLYMFDCSREHTGRRDSDAISPQHFRKKFVGQIDLSACVSHRGQKYKKFIRMGVDMPVIGVRPKLLGQIAQTLVTGPLEIVATASIDR